MRIASGFMDLRGVRELLARLQPETRVEVLLGLAGCSGPEVVKELCKRENIVVRASRVVAFHWKLACIESDAGRSIYIGSANFTRKGMSGMGEIMLRMSGSALGSGCWESIHRDFDEYFSPDKTLDAAQATDVLATVEGSADEARGAQADFEAAIEQVLAKASTHSVLAVNRMWLVTWHRDLTPRETALTTRAMGAPRSESLWTRGEVDGSKDRMQQDDIALCYSRDATWFVLGRVGKLCEVDMGRGERSLFADLEHFSQRIVRVRLSGDTQSAENAAAYDRVRATIHGLEDGLMSSDASHKIVAILRESGLLLATHEVGAPVAS
ncbi:MAG: phospholipase D family protein [Polyangiales bacterium]